mmetsp:Transcript_112953/g.269185  ORF Transcript_112953/g.269185 Transcript_112953/m.269185 type:complete len:235 (+) Transcript_112953:310-1014(+)
MLQGEPRHGALGDCQVPGGGPLGPRPPSLATAFRLLGGVHVWRDRHRLGLRRRAGLRGGHGAGGPQGADQPAPGELRGAGAFAVGGAAAGAGALAPGGLHLGRGVGHQGGGALGLRAGAAAGGSAHRHGILALALCKLDHLVCEDLQDRRAARLPRRERRAPPPRGGGRGIWGAALVWAHGEPWVPGPQGYGGELPGGARQQVVPEPRRAAAARGGVLPLRPGGRPGESGRPVG